MTVDFWSSSHDAWLARDYSSLTEQSEQHSLPTEEVTYVINAIDSLADQLPRFVRNNHLHYAAMILAHRFMQTLADCVTGMDGEVCCETAAVALFVAIEADGRSIPSPAWDSAVMKVFPCQVVHRATASAVAGMRGEFLEALNFDLFVHQPFETVSLLLAEVSATPATASVAFGIINSLFRTTVVVQYPPYVLAVAAVTGALLMTAEPAEKVEKLLARTPVDESVIQEILEGDLFDFVKCREIPLPEPPTVQDQPSPSARTGRSVSRQSSRIPSTRSQRSTVKRKREDPITSLSWALLPTTDENFPATTNRSGQRRPVGLSELRILREISAQAPPGIVKLLDVRLHTPSEESMHKLSSGVFSVSGQFDASGSQFDSIVRLLGSESQLIDVVEQLLSATLYLNELKICHFGIEPKNLMITTNCVKIASLSTATVLPTVPTTLPSLPYRAPELLLGSTGGAKDDPLAVDLWSVGCVVAEITRIHSTRNRYEDPLFRLTDAMPDKPTAKFPVSDMTFYTNCRYVIRMIECLQKGIVPARDVWPDMPKRGNYEGLLKLMKYKHTHFPDKKINGQAGDDLRNYMRDKDDGVVTEIVRALLRWCPERRVNPRVCLARIIKHKIN